MFRFTQHTLMAMFDTPGGGQALNPWATEQTACLWAVGELRTLRRYELG